MGIIYPNFQQFQHVHHLCVTHFVKGAQFLNATLVSAATAATFMSPVTRIYASE